MAKKKSGGTGEFKLFPETEQLIALLSKESDQDIVVIAIPSHDRRNRPLPEALAAEWATNAMRLAADLYRGATAYQAFKGVFATDEGHHLWDRPIIIESFATIEAIHDPERLNLLVEFAKRMGKILDQASVMLVFGTVMYYIEDYSGV